MLWRDLAGRLRGLAEWVDRYHAPGHLVMPKEDVIRELCRLCLEVDRETADQIVRRLGHGPTDPGAPPPWDGGRRVNNPFSLDNFEP